MMIPVADEATLALRCTHLTQAPALEAFHALVVKQFNDPPGATALRLV